MYRGVWVVAAVVVLAGCGSQGVRSEMPKLCEREWSLEKVAADDLVVAFWSSLSEQEQAAILDVGDALLRRDEARLKKWMPTGWDLDELFFYALEFDIEPVAMRDPSNDDDFFVTTADGQPGKRIHWGVETTTDDMELVVYLEFVDGRPVDDSICIHILKTT